MAEVISANTTGRSTPGLAGKRIIIVLAELEMGGAERQALLLARHLAHEQHAQVEVWGIIGQPGRVAKLCDELGIKWRLVPIGWTPTMKGQLKSLWRLAIALRRARPHIILPYTTLPSVVCGLVWKATGARACYFNLRDEGRDIRANRSQHLAIRWVTKVLTNAQHAADLLIRTFNIDPDRVRVIRNGVEMAAPQANRATWRRQLGISDGCFVACMVANLHQYKDHATLLRAWRLFLDQYNAESKSSTEQTPLLLLAGSFGDTHTSLQSLARELGIEDNMRFMGPVSDVTGLLGAVDLEVFSSQTEGCPNGVLECMKVGLPVVGTDIPGIREALGQHSSELLALPEDAATFASHIFELHENPDLRARIGAENQQRIATEFNPQRMCREMVELMQESLR